MGARGGGLVVVVGSSGGSGKGGREKGGKKTAQFAPRVSAPRRAGYGPSIENGAGHPPGQPRGGRLTPPTPEPSSTPPGSADHPRTSGAPLSMGHRKP